MVGILPGALAVLAAGSAAATTPEEALSLARTATIQLLAVIGVLTAKTDDILAAGGASVN